MAATCKRHSTNLSPVMPAPASQRVLYLAFDLGWSSWSLAFATASADNPRLRKVTARDLPALLKEIVKAKERFGMPADAPVISCFEAGRDGFWLHRYLTGQGIHNSVIDAASIEVSRRKRQRKTDPLDAAKLLGKLMRWHQGEKKIWSVVQVPSVADEDRRQLHRDLLEMKAERTQHVNRIRSLLALCGLAVAKVTADLPAQLAQLRTWDGQALPGELQQRLLREHQRWQFVDRQIQDLEKERARRVRDTENEPVRKVRQLLGVRGLGLNSAWLYVFERFGWRRIRNRRQLGALVGLTPTPYSSGDSDQELGISKAGNRRLRTMAVEIAWCWLRYQPSSALSGWYYRRWGDGNRRQRRIGIVALARKLLVALWRYLETGEPPQGAVLVAWESKHGSPKKARPVLA
jgi:transposase